MRQGNGDKGFFNCPVPNSSEKSALGIWSFEPFLEHCGLGLGDFGLGISDFVSIRPSSFINLTHDCPGDGIDLQRRFCYFSPSAP
jgi:hypothetical protein